MTAYINVALEQKKAQRDVLVSVRLHMEAFAERLEKAGLTKSDARLAAYEAVLWFEPEPHHFAGRKAEE